MDTYNGRFDQLFAAFYEKMLTPDDLKHQSRAMNAVARDLLKHMTREEYLKAEQLIGDYVEIVAFGAFEKGFRLAVELLTDPDRETGMSRRHCLRLIPVFPPRQPDRAGAYCPPSRNIVL